MAVIKLLKVNTMQDGTEKFQSQLYVGTDTCNFIRRTDNIMRNYNNGNKGFDFYEYTKPYIIVDDIKEIERQEL